MKLKILLLALASAAAVRNVSAGVVCFGASLDGYSSLGSGGCTMGTDTFASFTVLSGTLGATEIDPVDVSIQPDAQPGIPALQFNLDAEAAAGTTLEVVFTYTVSGPGLAMNMLTLSDSAETGDGAVSDIQNFCIGGTFGPDGVDGCTGSASGLLFTLDGAQNMDQAALNGAAMIAVTDDITVDGGMSGSASAGRFEDSFTDGASASTTPEPATILLAGFALAGTFFAIRRTR
jgi:hypothetical protein